MSRTLIQRVRALIANVLGVNRTALKPDTDLTEELGADSLDKVEVAMSLEETFDVEIRDSEAIAIDTVKDAAELVGEDAEESDAK